MLMAALFDELRQKVDAVRDPGETRGEHVQQRGDAGEQKDGGERHLYDVRNAVER